MDIIPHPRFAKHCSVLMGPNPQYSHISTPSSENVRWTLFPLEIWHFTFWSIQKRYGCVISSSTCIGTMLLLALFGRMTESGFRPPRLLIFSLLLIRTRQRKCTFLLSTLHIRPCALNMRLSSRTSRVALRPLPVTKNSH